MYSTRLVITESNFTRWVCNFFFRVSCDFILMFQIDNWWFKEINRNVSIDMFYSILAVLFSIKKFKILLSKLGFQKLNKLFNSQVRSFAYPIIFRSTKMLGEIADLGLFALMSLRPYVCAFTSFAFLSAPFCLRPYVGFRKIENTADGNWHTGLKKY